MMRKSSSFYKTIFDCYENIFEKIIVVFILLFTMHCIVKHGNITRRTCEKNISLL